MKHHDKFDIAPLQAAFNRIDVALSLSDLSAPDQPLLAINPMFTTITGYGEDFIGHNCRALQAEFANTEARAEIRNAIAEQRETQVILKNRRKNGEAFRNLLLLRHLGTFTGVPEFAVGAQFDLGPCDADRDGDWNGNGDRVINTLEDATFLPSLPAMAMVIEQRRIMFNAAVQLARSHCRMGEVRFS